MTVINTNTASLLPETQYNGTIAAMSTAMERLSTGSRINSAKDDAWPCHCRQDGRSGVRPNTAVRNANDAISLLQTVDGAAQEISNMLNRMYELAVQAASGTYTSTDRTALDLEFGELMKEIQEIAERTEWNGTSIMDDTYDDTTNALKFSSAWRSADAQLARHSTVSTRPVYNLSGPSESLF